jgi:flagellin
MNQAMVRIASGLRINSASDDAGGLAVGMKLSNEATITSNIQQNVENTKSFVVAQSNALDTAEEIVSQMATVKGNFDAASADEKATYASEFAELQSQLNMITNETYNSDNLFGTNLTSHNVSTTSDGSGVINVGQLNLNAGSINALISADINQIDNTQPDYIEASDITDAHNEVTSHIAKAGGTASTLGFASSYLETKATNLEAARSRIMDADIVEETTNLSKYTIQYEATVAALTQANATQQTVMELLLFPNKS